MKGKSYVFSLKSKILTPGKNGGDGGDGGDGNNTLISDIFWMAIAALQQQ